MFLERNSFDALLITTTERSYSDANKLAKMILKNNLAACVSLKNITSTFWWKEQLEESSEVEITIKTIPEFKEKVFKFIIDNHTYQLPELICFKADSTEEYSRWLRDNIN